MINSNLQRLFFAFTITNTTNQGTAFKTYLQFDGLLNSK